MKKDIDLTATAAIIGAILCWSSVPLFLKYFTSFIDAWTANGIRYSFAAFLLLPWLISSTRKGLITKKTWKLAILPSAINLVSQVLWAWTPYFISPGLISFLVRLSTVWVVLGSLLLFKDERALARSLSFWIGLSLAIGGFIVITLGSNYSFGYATVTGIVLVILTSLGWAGYQLAVRKNMQSVDSRVAFGMISSLTSIGLLVLMFSFGKSEQALEMPLSVSILVLISGLLGIACAHLLFYVAIKRIGVAIASSACLSSSFITALLSRFLFNEILTPAQWLAGVGMVLGAALLIRAQVHIRIE